MLTPKKGELREIVNQIVSANDQIAKLQRGVEELYAKLDAFDAPKYDVPPSKVFPPGYRGEGV